MKPSKLENLLHYYHMTRRAGHTSLMLEGINYDRPGIILFASNGHARMALDQAAVNHRGSFLIQFASMKLGNVQFRSIGMLDNIFEATRGVKQEDLLPVIVDHFAMQILVDEHNKKMEEFYVKNKKTT